MKLAESGERVGSPLVSASSSLGGSGEPSSITHVIRFFSTSTLVDFGRCPAKRSQTDPSDRAIWSEGASPLLPDSCRSLIGTPYLSSRGAGGWRGQRGGGDPTGVVHRVYSCPCEQAQEQGKSVQARCAGSPSCYRHRRREATVAPEEFRLSVHSECVRVSGFPPLTEELHHMSFADLGVSRPVADALKQRGIVAPFPIQKLVIEDVLAGHDVLVQSPTGSGKTLAFGLPLVDLVAPDGPKPAALVLVPTRELALQIVDDLRDLAASRSLSIAEVYGGVAIEKQAREGGARDIVGAL